MIEWPIAELVPHAGNMILLDHVLSFDDDTLRAVATVRADCVFAEADGRVPHWIGIEIMAQGVAAWAGCQAKQAGRPVSLGFLLGTRRFDCQVSHFNPGWVLDVSLQRCLHDEAGMGMFECHLHHAGSLLASARLNVFSPPDASAFINETPVSEAGVATT